MVGFRDDGAKYILFVIDCILCSNIGGALGFILGVVAPTPEVAFALGPVCCYVNRADLNLACDESTYDVQRIHINCQ